MSTAHLLSDTSSAIVLRDGSAPRRRVRRVLAWVALSAVALALIFAVGGWAGKRELSNQVDAIRRSIEIDSLALRGIIAKYRFLPFTAAQHPTVLSALQDSHDAAAIREANLYLGSINRAAGSEALYLMDARGLTVAASNWNEVPSFVGQSYTNRPYFVDASTGKEGVFYGIGQTTGEPGLFLSSPVTLNGKVLGVMAVKVSLRDIQNAWLSGRDPIVLTDARGIVFLSSVPEWLYRATRDLSADDLKWIARHKQYGDREHFARLPWTTALGTLEKQGRGGLVQATVQGKMRRFVTVDQALSDFGWRLVVMGDYAPVAKARSQAWALAALCTAVLLLGGFYWRLREHRFAEQRDARRELEQRVRERTRELDDAHALQKSMEDSLVVGMRARDLDGRIIYVNPALCAMTGYEEKDLLGQMPPYPYWHPDELDEHWRNFFATASGEAARSGFESRMRHRSGHDVLTMTYTAQLIDATGKHTGWMSSVVDITAQKLAESRQRDHQQQLQHAQRLASLGEMASTLAHELNQPLMALSNYASAAKAFALQDNRALLIESLDEAARQAQRSADIVKRIRGFVSHRTAGIERCEIEAMVQNTLALLRGEIRSRDARVRLDIAPDLPPVLGDRVLLEQVLLNLVLNGLQAMERTVRQRRVIDLHAHFESNRLVVRVADRGIGVDPSIADQLFVAFFTSRPDGLGLGLSICRTIAERHGGSLSFSARDGGGTVFKLELVGIS